MIRGVAHMYMSEGVIRGMANMQPSGRACVCCDHLAPVEECMSVLIAYPLCSLFPSLPPYYCHPAVATC